MWHLTGITCKPAVVRYGGKHVLNTILYIFPPVSPPPGNRCQETIPAGSGAPSSQEDSPQARADGGTEAGDPGGL